MIPFYKTSVFWSAVVGALVTVGMGIGYQREVEALAAVAGIVIAYLVSAGIITKAEIHALSLYEQGYEKGLSDAYESISKEQ